MLGNLVRQQVRKAQESSFYAPGNGPQPAYTPPRETAASANQVRVDYVPPTAAKPERKREFQGGEYIDYEEV
ncbi:MAG: hypothetical protein EOO36_05165 [Cytophagaceae bacterium]|nr:MAG: hypothetical protein EOO36_05165 [Cytophagaceae bacterium]